MAAIVACYSLFNEETQVATSIRSIKAYVDRVLVIDSAFITNPMPVTHSTDATRQVCEYVCADMPLTYVESDRRLHEYEARNLYLDGLAEGDWALVIDGDEVLYGKHTDVLELTRKIRMGEFDAAPAGSHAAAVAIPVFTQMVNVSGAAPGISAETYATAPIICSGGLMGRFFRVDASLRYPALPSNRGLFRGGVWVGAPAHECHDVFLVNHRPASSYEGYQNDYEWLSKVRTSDWDKDVTA